MKGYSFHPPHNASNDFENSKCDQLSWCILYGIMLRDVL